MRFLFYLFIFYLKYTWLLSRPCLQLIYETAIYVEILIWNGQAVAHIILFLTYTQLQKSLSLINFITACLNIFKEHNIVQNHI